MAFHNLLIIAAYLLVGIGSLVGMAWALTGQIAHPADRVVPGLANLANIARRETALEYSENHRLRHFCHHPLPADLHLVGGVIHARIP